MASKKNRILAVDDNRAILNVARFTLENAGFHVTTARDGRAAWRLLQEEDFELMLTDYRMPHMDGEMLCKRIQEEERLRGMPIILLSAKGLELDLSRLRAELGVSEVMFKPFSPSGLVATVKRCLSANASLV
jgi:CheY-like chemotaxis protein